jgi:ribosomal RNA methyltransferase Nop2
LDESLVTRKRKNAPEVAIPDRKKRSRTAVRELKAAAAPPSKKGAANLKTWENGKPVQKNGGPKTAKGASKTNGTSKKAPAVDDDSDDMDAGLDGVNVTGLDALGSADEMDDDFDDSDLELVDDSDDEPRRMGMWSSDEDEDDVEEKLTAANIEGLSKKLDMQKAVEEAEAAAELEEANMQTNIVGDRPKILDDEEDDEGRRISTLVTQDVQLLRTRLNDVVRVLSDFKTLAEPGRDRAEYRYVLQRFLSYNSDLILTDFTQRTNAERRVRVLRIL